jgi:ribosomal protein S18 acetylase RimI-like enzyme
MLVPETDVEEHLLSSEKFINDEDVESSLQSISENALDIAKNLEYRPVTIMNLKELQSINTVLFPMAYQERYYREVLALDSFARLGKFQCRSCNCLVYWMGRMVATFSCRLQPFYVNEVPYIECYIMTFGALAPYRRLKIGSVMIKAIIDHYGRRKEVKRIMLHVHTANEGAIKFYIHHGFQIVQSLPNYYRRLSPSSAYLLTYHF